MSLDLFLEKTQCPTCNHAPERIAFNYTYNVSPMWSAIYPDANEMVDIDGMTGTRALLRITYALTYMRDHRRKLEKFNPRNNWGNYSGFIDFLNNIRTACEENPDLIWSSWR